MTVMRRQSEEQWEDVRALAPPPKRETEISFTCFQQKLQSLKEFNLKSCFSPARPFGLSSTSASPPILQIWF